MALETVVVVATSAAWTLVSNASAGRFRAQVLEGVPALFSIGATAPAADLELGMPAVSLNFDALDGKVWVRGAGIDVKVAVARVIDAGNPAIPMVTALALSGTSFPTLSVAGTVIGTISNRVAGSKIEVSPNDGRFAISDDGTTARLVVGLSASKAGTTQVTITETSRLAANSPRRTKFSVECTPPIIVDPTIPTIASVEIVPLTAGASWASPRYRDMFRAVINTTGVYSKVAISWRADGNSAGQFRPLVALDDRFVGKVARLSVSLLNASNQVVAGPWLSTNSGIVTDNLVVLDNFNDTTGRAQSNGVIAQDTTAGRFLRTAGLNIRSNGATSSGNSTKTIGNFDGASLGVIAMYFNQKSYQTGTDLGLSFKRTSDTTYTTRTLGKSSMSVGANFADGGDWLLFDTAEENGSAAPITALTPAQSLDMRVWSTPNPPYIADVTVDCAMANARGIPTLVPTYDDMRATTKNKVQQWNALGVAVTIAIEIGEIDGPEDGSATLRKMSAQDIIDMDAAGNCIVNDMTTDDTSMLACTSIAEVLAGWQANEDWIAANTSGRGLKLGVAPFGETRTYGHPSDITITTTAGSTTATLTTAPVVPVTAGMRFRGIASIGRKNKIPVGGVNGLTLTLESAATASGTYTGQAYDTAFNGSIITQLNTTSGSAVAQIVTAPAVAPRLGQTIRSLYFPAGTTITAINGSDLTLSANATANSTNAPARTIETTGIFFENKLEEALRTQKGVKFIRGTSTQLSYTRFGFGDRALNHPGYGMGNKALAVIKADTALVVQRGGSRLVYIHGVKPGGSGLDMDETVHDDWRDDAIVYRDAGRLVILPLDEFIARDLDGATRLPAAA